MNLLSLLKSIAINGPIQDALSVMSPTRPGILLFERINMGSATFINQAIALSVAQGRRVLVIDIEQLGGDHEHLRAGIDEIVTDESAIVPLLEDVARNVATPPRPTTLIYRSMRPTIDAPHDYESELINRIVQQGARNSVFVMVTVGPFEPGPVMRPLAPFVPIHLDGPDRNWRAAR